MADKDFWTEAADVSYARRLWHAFKTLFIFYAVMLIPAFIFPRSWWCFALFLLLSTLAYLKDGLPRSRFWILMLRRRGDVLYIRYRDRSRLLMQECTVAEVSVRFRERQPRGGVYWQLYIHLPGGRRIIQYSRGQWTCELMKEVFEKLRG